MNKGFVFSFDALIAMFILLIMILLMVTQTKILVGEEVNEVKEFELKSKGLFYADSLVKNFDENGVKGIAYFNEEKKRVESNKLDYFSLKKINAWKLDFVKEIAIEFKEGEKEIIFSKEMNSEKCFAFERFVLINEKKTKIKIIVCD